MKTKIFAHRGAMGDYPENTMLAFRKALDMGVDGLEIDVHMTLDGELVVIHDGYVDRTTDGQGPVKDMLLSEVKEYSAGARFSDFESYEKEWDEERIPTLAEVLQLVGEYDVDLNIELKTSTFPYAGIEGKVSGFVSSCGLGNRVVYSSFHLPSLLRMKQIQPEARVAWLMKVMPGLPFDYIETLGLEGLHVDYRSVLKNTEALNGAEDKIRAWTVEAEADAEKLFELEVGAVMTNYPEKILKLRSERV